MRESFTERMEAGRDLAQWHRNPGRRRGAPAKGWNTKRSECTDLGSWDHLCREARRDWRDAVRQARNDFAAACLNPLHDQPETWEFN
jgi:hypothetical protein